MILSKEKRVVMFQVPRTGTNTLTRMFRNTGIKLDVCNEEHFGYRDIFNSPEYAAEMGITNPTDYTYYSFYRDPLDRCISVVNYLRRGKQCAKFFHAFYGDDFPISCAYRKPYAEWTDEMRQMCDSVPLIEVFRKFRWFFERGVYGKTQKRWLDGPVIPMNFDDYDNEVRRILVKFGIDPVGVTIPHINPSVYLPEYDELNDADRAELMEFLKEDYDFLEAKGIRFK